MEDNKAGKDNEKEKDKAIKQKISQYSPELQRLSKVDLLVEDDTKDALTNLSEFEITVISLYRAIDKDFFEIPGTIAFLDNIVSLRRSLEGMGIQNLVEILKKRPDYQFTRGTEEDLEEEVKSGFREKLKFWKKRGS